MKKNYDIVNRQNLRLETKDLKRLLLDINKQLAGEDIFQKTEGFFYGDFTAGTNDWLELKATVIELLKLSVEQRETISYYCDY